MTNEGAIEIQRSEDLIRLYRKRLHLPSNEYSLQPNLSTLRLLSERHLQYMPFENIVMHRSEKKKRELNSTNDDNGDLDSSIIQLSREELIKKLLIFELGGCCLELNGLLSMLLKELGYESVKLVPCYVFAGKERGHRNKKAKFRVTASHFVLLVTISREYMMMNVPKPDTGGNNTFNCTHEQCNSFIVDVGLGEPSLWPMEYVLDKEQFSPEGMTSRMVWDKPWIDRVGTKRQCIVLEWLVGSIANEKEKEEGIVTTSSSIWEPRLQWDVNDAPLILGDKYSHHIIHPRQDELDLDAFRYVIPMLLNPKSNFAKKLVVCKLTRDAKVTLAGRVLKVTTPRFHGTSKKTVKDLTKEEVYEVLQTEFGITLNTKLCLPSIEYSKKSKLWDHL